MKKRTNMILIALCLLCTAPVCLAQSGNSPIEGTWNIRSVNYSRTVDGKTSITLYTTLSPQFGITRCPYKVIFEGGVATFVYAGDARESGSYTYEGNNLRVGFITHTQDYTCTFVSNNLMLKQVTAYVINDNENNKVQQARDECTFQATRQNP
jgi:hypothetical protein